MRPVGGPLSRRDVDVGEAGGSEPVVVFGGQGPGDAADSLTAFGAFGGEEVVLGYHVGDADASARPEDAKRLGLTAVC